MWHFLSLITNKVIKAVNYNKLKLELCSVYKFSAYKTCAFWVNSLLTAQNNISVAWSTSVVYVIYVVIGLKMRHWEWIIRWVVYPSTLSYIKFKVVFFFFFISFINGATSHEQDRTHERSTQKKLLFHESKHPHWVNSTWHIGLKIITWPWEHPQVCLF